MMPGISKPTLYQYVEHKLEVSQADPNQAAINLRRHLEMLPKRCHPEHP